MMSNALVIAKDGLGDNVILYVFLFLSPLLSQLQTPASFAQSVQELTIALQRTGDPANLNRLRPHLELLADIDPSPGVRPHILYK